MEINKQVCNLELAKQLKKLGVKQKSLFWWQIDWNHIVVSTDFEGHMPLSFETSTRDKRKRVWVRHPENNISAFTVAELGEMLPDFVQAKKWPAVWTMWYEDDAKDANGWPRLPHIQPAAHDGDSEADYRARVLIYLLENNLIKP